MGERRYAGCNRGCRAWCRVGKPATAIFSDQPKGGVDMCEFTCESCGTRLRAWEPPRAPGTTCIDGKGAGEDLWDPIGMYSEAPRSTYFCPDCGAEMRPVDPAREIPS